MTQTATHAAVSRDANRVLLIAPHGSYRTGAFVEAAQRQGIQLLVASEGKHSVVSTYASGLHLDFSFPDQALSEIQAIARQTPFTGVIGTDDATTELAAQAAKSLGLPHNPPAAVSIARRKDLSRQRLHAAGVQVPDYQRIELNREINQSSLTVAFPAVLKPLSLSASRGVMRVDDLGQLQQACQRLSAILRREYKTASDISELALLEEFIPGNEVAVEGMLYQGNLQVLAVFDKPDPLDGPFFEESYYITPSRHSRETLDALHETVQSACRAYGLLEGPVHAECRINPQGIWLIEMAARTIGGLCGRLLTLGTAYQLEDLVLLHAIGQPVQAHADQQAAGVLMIPIPRNGVFKRVEGLLAAQKVPGIESISLQVAEGHRVTRLPEGESYLGFIFARHDTPAKAEAALREAHACLRLIIDPLWNVRVNNEAL